MNPIAIYPYKEDPEIRKMRVQAWFRAVSLASGLTTHELEKKFSESDDNRKVKRSCAWNKYRRGTVVPRGGPRPDGGLNLVDRVEAEYSGTAKWLTLPLWRLLDKAPMEMSEIRLCYESLPRPIRAMFIRPDATKSSVFWRPRELNCKKDGELLLRFEDLDGVTALIAMLRETESAQLQRQNEICMQIAHEYARRLTKDSVLGECMQRLSAYCFGASTRI